MTAFGSIIKIIKGCPLDKDYNHTLWFANNSQQQIYFDNLSKYTLSNQSYQRVGKNKMRIQRVADDLYDCNYLAFQNTSYGNKWFYAFIDSVDYINDNVSEINYTVDVMQTWYYDYILGECFVEREHVSDDTIGANIVAEDFNCEADIVASSNNVPFTYMLGGIMLNKKPPDHVTYTKGTSTYSYPIKYITMPTEAPCGISNSLYILTGFALDSDEAINHFRPLETQYRMQSTVYSKLENSTETYEGLTLGFVIDDIVNGRGSGADSWYEFSENNIVTAFQFPANFLQTNNISYAESALGYRYGTSAQDISGLIQRPVKFYKANATTDVDKERNSDYYIPINNKLYTYPYCHINVSNNQGVISQYKFEDFYNTNSPTFRWVGNYFPNINCMLFPINYKHTSVGYNEGVPLTNYPIPSYKGDTYTAWLQSNRNAMFYGIISSAVNQSNAGAAKGYYIGNKFGLGQLGLGFGGVTGLVGGAINGIVNAAVKGADLKNTPPKTYGQISNEGLNASMNRNGYYVEAVTIRKEIAEIIDNYFNMFGYAVNTVKVPNVISGNGMRPHWNYIKTNGCVIHGRSGKGLPSEDEDLISKIFDKGITFWNPSDEVGDYSLDNRIK